MKRSGIDEGLDYMSAAHVSLIVIPQSRLQVFCVVLIPPPQKKKADEETIMVSFDVVSLFTKASLQEAMLYISDLLHDDETLEYNLTTLQMSSVH